MSDTPSDSGETSTETGNAGTVLGSRLRCAVCGSQAVVTKAADAADLRCHEQPLEVVSAPTAAPTP